MFLHWQCRTIDEKFQLGNIFYLFIVDVREGSAGSGCWCSAADVAAEHQQPEPP